MRGTKISTRNISPNLRFLLHLYNQFFRVLVLCAKFCDVRKETYTFVHVCSARSFQRIYSKVGGRTAKIRKETDKQEPRSSRGASGYPIARRIHDSLSLGRHCIASNGLQGGGRLMGGVRSLARVQNARLCRVFTYLGEDLEPRRWVG